MLAHRLLSFILSGVFLMLMSCQQKPTKVMEESVDVFEPRTVLIDTRDSLQFQSYHIQGSVNLNSFDFLILKNAKTQKRILDPDLNQIIERLARRGVAPDRRVILLSENANDLENKKWRWLLKNLEVDNVQMMSLSDFKKKNTRNSFAEPERQMPWLLQTSEVLQQELILKKAPVCFVNWSDKKCDRF